MPAFLAAIQPYFFALGVSIAAGAFAYATAMKHMRRYVQAKFDLYSAAIIQGLAQEEDDL